MTRKPAPPRGWLARSIDRVVESVAPEAAIRRRAARLRLHGLDGMQARIGAGRSYGRLMDWRPTTDDATAAIIDDLPTVREKARDAAINNPAYRAIREALTAHVVGGTGLQPEPTVDRDRLGITPEREKEWNDAVNTVWHEDSRNADSANRAHSWASTLRAVFRGMFDGGDVFVGFPRRVWPEGVGNRTRLFLIEAERVETPRELLRDPAVRGGVQYDAWGAPMGYWLRRKHPGDRKATERPARDHEYWPRFRGDRINAVQVMHEDRHQAPRGVPFLASVLDLLDQVQGYVDSTILSAEIQTRLAFWIQTAADPSTFAGPDPDGPTAAERSAAYAERFTMGVESGAVNTLEPGDEIQTVGQTTPGTYFDAFVIRLLRMACSSVGVPFSVAFLDNAGANYSSMRGEREAFRRVVETFQDALVPLCNRYRREVIVEAWKDGRLPVWGRVDDDPEGWLGCVWQRPPLPSIDPTKETPTQIAAIEAGITSPQRVISDRGGEWREMLRQRSEWIAEHERLGLSLPEGSPKPVGAATPATPPPPDDPDDDDDENDENDDDPERENAEPAEPAEVQR